MTPTPLINMISMTPTPLMSSDLEIEFLMFKKEFSQEKI